VEPVKEELSESIIWEALVTERFNMTLFAVIDFISVLTIVGVREVEPPPEDDPPPPPVPPPLEILMV
jgi:hypothetical protein